MWRAVGRAAIGVGSVAAIAALMVVGSQAIRQPHAPKVAVVTRSPIAMSCSGPADNQTCTTNRGAVSNQGDRPPVDSQCISEDVTQCNPACDPAVYSNCVPIASPQGGPAVNPNPSAGSVAPAGQIEAAVTSFVVGDGPGARVGVMVAVLAGGQYVSGAGVNGTVAGIAFSGTTAARSAWAATTDPSIPSGPGAFYWVVLTGNFHGQQLAHGTVTYSGMTASF